MKSLIFVHEVLDFCIGFITMQRLKRLGNHIFRLDINIDVFKSMPY